MDDSTTIQEDGIIVTLTSDLLEYTSIMESVKSPKAGAIVLFAGTTRNHYDSKPVKELQYSAYIPRALKSMLAIAQSIKAEYALIAITMIHRLGIVPVGAESILIAVSAPHRQAAWRAGEEALEKCKQKVEIWKLEKFDDEQGVWRAN